MNIHTDQTDSLVPHFYWQAVTDDYDGAPDAGPQPVGNGSTEQEAIDDLLEQLEDSDT